MAYVEYEADGKTIKARVQQKTDTLANWMANDMVLKAGEQAFVINDDGTPLNFKIGDGTKLFRDLPNWIDFSNAQRVSSVDPGVLPAGPAEETRYMEVTEIGTYTYGGNTLAEITEDGYKATFWWTGTEWISNGVVKLKGDTPTGTDTLQPELVPKGKAVSDYVQPIFNTLDGVQVITEYEQDNFTLTNQGINLSGSAGGLTDYSLTGYITMPTDYDYLDIPTFVSGTWASVAFYSNQTVGGFLKSYSGDGTGMVRIYKKDLPVNTNYFRLSWKTSDLGSYIAKSVLGDTKSYDDVKRELTDNTTHLQDISILLDGDQSSVALDGSILTLTNQGINLAGSAGTLADYSLSPYLPIPDDIDIITAKTFPSGIWASIAFYTNQTVGGFVKSYSGDGTGQSDINRNEIPTANYYRVSCKTTDIPTYEIIFTKGDGVPYKDVKTQVESNTQVVQSYGYEVEGDQSETNYNSSILTNDNTVLLTGGGSTTVAGYKSSPYLSIPENSDFLDVKLFSSLNYVSLVLYSTASVGTKIEHFFGGVNTPSLKIDLRNYPTAKYYRVSYPTASLSDFYLKFIRGTGQSVKDIEYNFQTYLSLEDAQKNSRVGNKLIQAGNILAKQDTSTVAKIDNINTQLKYDILNYERLKPQGKITHRKYYNASNKYIHWIDNSGNGKVYWSDTTNNKPFVSNSIEDFIAGTYTDLSNGYSGDRGIVGLRLLDNGELILLQQQNTTTGANGVYVSTGWADGNETNTAPTWSKKLTYMSFQNGQMDSWGLSVRGNKIMVSEYCTNRVENSAVWYSKDYGNTFTQVATVASLGQYSGDSSDYKQHIHGCCVDPYWDRLWIILGESAKTGQFVIAYSDNEGANWTCVGTNYRAKALVNNTIIPHKFCGAYAYKSGLVMGTDHQPNGIWRYNRNTKSELNETQTVNIEEVKRIDLKVVNTPLPGYSGHERYITHIMGYTIASPNNDYYLVSANYSGLVSTTYEEDRSSILYFTCDGVQFWEIYREEDTVNYPNRDGFVDNSFKGFVLKDGRVILFSSGSGRNAGNTVIIGNMPNIL